jgi:hypothetical protein
MFKCNVAFPFVLRVTLIFQNTLLKGKTWVNNRELFIELIVNLPF